jgi:hypothetical protein
VTANQGATRQVVPADRESADESTRRVRDEFDRIALLTEQHGGGAGDAYYEYLLRRLPTRVESALEIGCGRSTGWAT